MNMEKMMKECIKPHPLLHTVTGIGLGILLTNWFGMTGDTSMMLGWGLLVAGILGEFVISKK